MGWTPADMPQQTASCSHIEGEVARPKVPILRPLIDKVRGDIAMYRELVAMWNHQILGLECELRATTPLRAYIKLVEAKIKTQEEELQHLHDFPSKCAAPRLNHESTPCDYYLGAEVKVNDKRGKVVGAALVRRSEGVGMRRVYTVRWPDDNETTMNFEDVRLSVVDLHPTGRSKVPAAIFEALQELGQQPRKRQKQGGTSKSDRQLRVEAYRLNRARCDHYNRGVWLEENGHDPFSGLAKDWSSNTGCEPHEKIRRHPDTKEKKRLQQKKCRARKPRRHKEAEADDVVVIVVVAVVVVVKALSTTTGPRGGARIKKRSAKPNDVDNEAWPFLQALAMQGELSRTANRVALERNLVQCHEALMVALELMFAR
jgi:hypothetical protein